MRDSLSLTHYASLRACMPNEPLVFLYLWIFLALLGGGGQSTKILGLWGISPPIIVNI